MTREEAIEVIEQDIPCEYDTDLIEALNMAQNALDEVEKYKKALKEVERVIDSELLEWKFIDATKAKNAFAITLRSLSEYIKDVENLDTVKPERPKGKWLTPYGSYSYRLTTYKCSLCGCETDNRSNYCPKCGADMREVKNE